MEMDKIISQANFMHKDDDDLRVEFYEKLETWRRDHIEKATMAEALAALNAAQDKICHPNFPPESSTGYYMGYYTLKELHSAIEDLINYEKAKPEDFHRPYLGFVMRMIELGPLSSHVEYIQNCFRRSSVQFHEYFQSLTGEELRTVVKAMMRQYTPDPGMDWDSYDNHLDQFMRMFISSYFSSDQFEKNQADFIDLYMYFITAFNTKEEKIRKKMQRFAYLIDLKYNRNVFKGVKDAGLLKRHLTHIRQVALAPEFPQGKDVGEAIVSALYQLLNTVSEGLFISEMYDDVMDLSLELTRKRDSSEAVRLLFEKIDYFFYHLKAEGFKGNEKLYTGLVVKFMQVLDQIHDDTFLTSYFAKAIQNHVLSQAMGKSRDHVVLWINMIKALLKHPTESCMYAAYYALNDKEKLLKWKEYPEQVKEIFVLISRVKFPDWLKDDQRKNAFGYLKDFVRYFVEGVSKAKLLKDIKDDMLAVVFRCIDLRDHMSYEMAYEMASRLEFNSKTDKHLLMKIVHFLTKILADDTYGWLRDDIPHYLPSTVQSLARPVQSVKDGKIFSWEEYDDLVSLCKQCQQGGFLRDDDNLSAQYLVYIAISFSLISWLDTMNESHRAARLLPGMLDMLESDNDNIKSMAGNQLTMITRSGGPSSAPYLERLIKIFLETEQDSLIGAISNVYESNPGVLGPYFQDLFQHIDSGNSSVKAYIRMLLQKVAKYQPDLFTKDNMEALMKEAREDTMQQVLMLMIVEEIGKRRPDKLTPFLDQLLKPDLWETNCSYTISNMLQYYAVRQEGEGVSRIMDYMIRQIQSSSDKTAVTTALNAIRLIGFKHRPLVEKYRGAIEKVRDSTKDNDHHSMCTAIIDMLDGKSLDKVAADVKALQEGVVDLEIRVVTVETNVVEVKDTVRRQGEDLGRVKDEVAEHGQRLDQVEETVEETVAKVEEIDGKTLSHAPFWSRDVSKLLNPEAEHDWRLLSRRLGYNNEDVRGWAQQSDPCMAMLNEWYATHKTRDATFAVLTALQDMGREDASAIVENAMKNAEAVVEDEEFVYATPPDIFISYQWGHQNEVRLLRQHLEMAGYSCWMDVGQMGGGDKLFEKIDSGIRGGKVVICCVSEKYSKSPNCNREVEETRRIAVARIHVERIIGRIKCYHILNGSIPLSLHSVLEDIIHSCAYLTQFQSPILEPSVNLTVSLGKPIIPLLMEKTTWPPPGAMGPIFSEYLFIRFFQRPDEATTDSRYWPLAKFQELLMQLSLNGVVPDEAAVQPEYKDWWAPQVEEIKVDKNRQNNKSEPASAAAASGGDKVTVSPEVFLSYQWGRQPQVTRLYKALTSQGFTCWLDIMQMGGGDSLYDKIDKGMRGCRVVVSCVTPKYALSANCRREVSLADALSKPVVPLLLEATPWPPPGPMGMVFTQLLYIDATDAAIQEKWAGPKFEELVAKIREHVPTAHDSRAGAHLQEQKSSQGGKPKPANDSGSNSPAPTTTSTTPPSGPQGGKLPQSGKPQLSHGLPGNPAPSTDNVSGTPPREENHSDGGRLQPVNDSNETSPSTQQEPVLFRGMQEARDKPHPTDKSVQNMAPPANSAQTREVPQATGSACCIIQ